MVFGIVLWLLSKCVDPTESAVRGHCQSRDYATQSLSLRGKVEEKSVAASFVLPGEPFVQIERAAPLWNLESLEFAATDNLWCCGEDSQACRDVGGYVSGLN